MSLKANYGDVNIFIGILVNCVVIYVVLKSLKMDRKFFRSQWYGSDKKIFRRNIAGHSGKNIWQ
jgi:hypothetical protein